MNRCLIGRKCVRHLSCAGLILGMGLALGWASPPARAQAQDPAKELISLNLADADVRDAIALVFQDSPLNYALADGVHGARVTLKVDNVAREKALQIILQGKGLEFSKEDGVYVIKPQARREREMVMGDPAPARPEPARGQLAPAQPGVGPDAGGRAPVAAAGRVVTVKIPLMHIGPTETCALLAGQGSVVSQLAGAGSLLSPGLNNGFGNGLNNGFGNGLNSGFGNGLNNGFGSAVGRGMGSPLGNGVGLGSGLGNGLGVGAGVPGANGSGRVNGAGGGYARPSITRP